MKQNFRERVKKYLDIPDNAVELLEIKYYAVMFFSLLIGFLTDIFILLNIAPIIFHIPSSLIYSTVSIIASVALIGMTMLSLIVSRSEKQYMGVNIAEFVVFSQSSLFSFKRILAAQLSIIFIGVLLSIVSFYNSILALLLTSFLLLWFMTQKIINMTFEEDKVKGDIEEAIRRSFGERSTLEEEKYTILKRVFQEARESVYNGDINSYDQTIQLIGKIVETNENSEDGIFIENEILRLFTDGLQVDSQRMFAEQYKKIISLYDVYNKKKCFFPLYEEIINPFLDNLRKLRIETVRNNEMDFDNLYFKIKENYKFHEGNPDSGFVLKYQAFCYTNLYNRYLDYYDIRIQDIVNISSYLYRRSPDETDILSVKFLFKEMIDREHSTNFNKYFVDLIDQSVNEINNEYIEQDSIIFTIVLYLIYLQDLHKNQSVNRNFDQAVRMLLNMKGEIYDFLLKNYNMEVFSRKFIAMFLLIITMVGK